MKKNLLILFGMLMAFPTFARDFEYKYEGQTITYTVISEQNKTVTTKEGGVGNPGNEVSGELIIPSKVTDGTNSFTVTSIGQYSFYGNDITSVKIPNSVESIVWGAFTGCSMTSVTIPASVTSIGWGAFSYCDNLTAIEVDALNNNYSSRDGVLFNKDFTWLVAFPAGNGISDYTIPDSVESIFQEAFSGCSRLTSVNIPGSVTSIDNYAFLDSGLISVNIPTSVTQIRHYAFSNCKSMTEIAIPNTVSFIGEGAFCGCCSLTSFSIPDVLTSIPRYVLRDCSSLTSITIPRSIVFIGEEAFYNCSNLSEITIPNTVKRIGEKAFNYCSRLESITLFNYLLSIGDYAFAYCDNLRSVYYAASEPIEGSSSIFSNYTFPTLYVPVEAVAKCKTIDPWKNFSQIEAYDFSGVDPLFDDIDDGMPYEVFDLNGVMLGKSVENLASGIYIVRHGKSVKKISVR